MTGLAEDLPRVSLGVFPTPVVRAHRLERALGCGPLLVKRDDLAGFAVAGNKTRPLEFLLGAATRSGATVLVTGGGPASNFGPAAALAARAAGLDCELVVWGDPGGPNLALARAAGASLRFTGDTDRDAVDELVHRRAEQLAAEGRRAYPVPRGGSTPTGAVGFAVAATELAAQLDRAPALIVLAVGSGGSCAGLLVGLAAAGLDVPVLGVSVSRPPDRITARVRQLAEGCAALLGVRAPLGRLDIVDAREPGFGTASARERGRALLALRTEGLLLDHTYGAKALAIALGRLADRPAAQSSAPVLFWHTGGVLPAIGAICDQGDQAMCTGAPVERRATGCQRGKGGS